MPLQLQKILFEDEYFQHYFLCHYIPKSLGSDLFSQSILAFKNGHVLHRQAWIDCAVSEIKKVRELQGSLIVRALGHDELRVSKEQRTMDHLGIKLAHTLSGSYRPDCLQKVKMVSKLTSLTRAQREKELQQAYRFEIPERQPKNILVIDDVLTTSATMRAILAAILKALPSVNIQVFTLGSTDHDKTVNANLALSAQSYGWEPNVGWMMVEEQSDQYAESFAKLKQMIMQDTFQ